MTVLTTQQIGGFINDGFVKIENAFPGELAATCRSILWKVCGCDPNDNSTWTKPVTRLGEMSAPAFQEAANTQQLHGAFNELVGKDNWKPKTSLGSFPIRFPSAEPATDTGWHVDASFPGDDVSDYFSWRINIRSKGRALLMLFLFSDVTELDAPTVLRIGSHADVARLLAPVGEAGLSFMELAQQLDLLPSRKEIFATGAAGTVYLCHPFLVHAAQNHLGNNPKFMAQPSLLPKHDFDVQTPGVAHCPVETAIIQAITHQ